MRESTAQGLMPRAEVLQGDCREILAGMPAGSIQCCITSPPYYGLRDYGHEGQIGLEQSPAEYVEQLVAVFREVRRVLHPSGLVFLNLGDSYAAGKTGRADHGSNNPTVKLAGNSRGAVPMGPVKQRSAPAGLKPKDLIGIPWRVAFALQADGWYLRQDCIWAKTAPMPESVTDRFTRAHEYIFLLAKRERYYFDAVAVREPMSEGSTERYKYAFGGAKNEHLKATDKPTAVVGNRDVTEGRNRRDVWLLNPEPTPFAHFATMPQALVEPCVLAGTSEKGCCPECLAPWQRMTERTDEPELSHNGSRFDRGKTVDARTPLAPVQQGERFRKVTTGWFPTCPHEAAADPIPCTVLDPFAGSGTVLRVAVKHGRRAIGIELNPEYIEIINRRLHVDVRLPLFDEEAVS